jgi:hypothetical protein
MKEFVEKYAKVKNMKEVDDAHIFHEHIIVGEGGN